MGTSFIHAHFIELPVFHSKFSMICSEYNDCFFKKPSISQSWNNLTCNKKKILKRLCSQYSFQLLYLQSSMQTLSATEGRSQSFQPRITYSRQQVAGVCLPKKCGGHWTTTIKISKSMDAPQDKLHFCYRHFYLISSITNNSYFNSSKIGQQKSCH